MESAMQSPRSTRLLPSNDPAAVRKLTNATLEDNYVAFILYCNPGVPSNLSTTELRRGFRSVPRADGKSFETLNVFRLQQRLEKGELQTWIALVLELGVEPGDTAKGGSSQKLQQYGVRLKRWLHTYHIDAFFQYLLGNDHSYFTHVPTGPEAYAIPRDGVNMEEDLALRALLPNLRPKRGRKKGQDDDTESIDTPNKRLRAGTPSTVDGRNSPRPEFWGRVSQSPAPYQPTPSSHMAHVLPAPPQAQHQSSNGQANELHELFNAANRAFPGSTVPMPGSSVGQSDDNPQGDTNQWAPMVPRQSAQYPQSAIDLYPPSNVFDNTDLNDGSRSAHPLASKASKTKKRGNKNTSAAWNITSPAGIISESGAKPRGRPPQKSNVRNGPFQTWSVKESVESPEQHNSSIAGSHVNQPPAAVAQMQQQNHSAGGPPFRPPSKKLSLTVPHQPGGNVRLATPPVVREERGYADASPLPRVTINDDGSLSRSRSSLSKTRERESNRERERQRNRLSAEDRNIRRSSADYFNTIDEEGSMNNDYENYDNDPFADEMSQTDGINWKQRAMILKKKLEEAQAELKRVKKAVLEAVM